MQNNIKESLINYTRNPEVQVVRNYPVMHYCFKQNGNKLYNEHTIVR